MPKKDKFELAATLDWYRQGANWLVGLSTGAIAAGLTLADRVQSQGTAARVVFLLAGLVFLVIVVLGVTSYFWLNAIGNQMEQEAKVTAEIGTGTATPTQQKALDDVQTELKESKKTYGSLYAALMWLFPVGAVLSAIAVLLITIGPSPAPAKHWRVAGADAPGIAAVMVEESTGEAWALMRDSTGRYTWRRTASDSSRPLTSR